MRLSCFQPRSAAVGMASLLLACAVLSAPPVLAQPKPGITKTTPIRTVPKTATSQGAGCLTRLNTTEKGHSLGNAYVFALVSHSMYPHAYPEGNTGLSNNLPRFRQKAKEQFTEWGATFLDVEKDIVDKDNVQFCVMSTNDAIIVAFRGSDAVDSYEGYDDWVGTDFDSKQKLYRNWGKGKRSGKWKYPGVHTGFLNAYLGVRNQINERITAHGGSSKKLFITGHSLGAALATLCAIDQGYSDKLSKHYKAQGVYTYGGPRVGNAYFADLYKRKKSAGGASALNTHRYVNFTDAICMYPFDDAAHDAAYVPLDLYGVGEPHSNVIYTHVGRTCNIRSDGQIVRDDAELRTDLGDPRTWARFERHHSKDYCHYIFYAFVYGKGSEASMPPKPVYPSDKKIDGME